MNKHPSPNHCSNVALTVPSQEWTSVITEVQFVHEQTWQVASGAIQDK
jgi:hypothetical protein